MGLRSWLGHLLGGRTPREPEAVWLRAGEGPFAIDVLDCRTTMLGWSAVTSNPDVAETFSALRRADGSAYCGRDPEGARQTEVVLAYRLEDPPPDGPLFKATAMEDKWDVYLYRPDLYFVRSWTGDLGYRARIAFAEGTARVTHIAHAPDEDPVHAGRVVDFLIKSHLYGQLPPHPVPRGVPEADVARYSFSMYGRRCGFASYEDTTVVPLVFREERQRGEGSG